MKSEGDFWCVYYLCGLQPELGLHPGMVVISSDPAYVAKEHNLPRAEVNQIKPAKGRNEPAGRAFASENYCPHRIHFNDKNNQHRSYAALIRIDLDEDKPGFEGFPKKCERHAMRLIDTIRSET